MGLTSVFLIHNDFLSRSTAEQLGLEINKAVSNYSYPLDHRNNMGAGKIVSMAHSSYPQITVVHKNTGHVFCQDPDFKEEDLAHLKELANHMGYSLRKLSKEKVDV